MNSQVQYAQRIEESPESGRSVRASYAHSEQSLPPEPEHRPQGGELRSRSREYKELRQLGAVDFNGTIDPAEVETWLKRTESM